MMSKLLSNSSLTRTIRYCLSAPGWLSSLSSDIDLETDCCRYFIFQISLKKTIYTLYSKKRVLLKQGPRRALFNTTYLFTNVFQVHNKVAYTSLVTRKVNLKS